MNPWRKKTNGYETLSDAALNVLSWITQEEVLKQQRGVDLNTHPL